MGPLVFLTPESDTDGSVYLQQETDSHAYVSHCLVLLGAVRASTGHWEKVSMTNRRVRDLASQGLVAVEGGELF